MKLKFGKTDGSMFNELGIRRNPRSAKKELIQALVEGS